MSEFKLEPKKTLDKIRLALSMYEMKLAQMKNEDGSVVFEAEKFEAEYSVGVVAEDGSIQAAPVGDFVLEDGSKMIIKQEGIIAMIEPAGAAQGDPAAVAAEVETGAPAAKKVVESVTKETFFSKQEAEDFLKEHEVALSKIKTLEEKKAELEVKLKEAEEVKAIKFNPEKRKEVKFEDMTPVEKFRATKAKY